MFIISLILSLAGILILLVISMNIQPKEIANYSDLKENDYVSVSGKIISEKYFQDSDFSIIKLENNITITCNCKFPVNSTIAVAGKVEDYNGKLQINAEKIKLKNDI